MSNLSSIRIALDVAETRRDDVTKYLAQTERDWVQAQAQLQQLEDYVVETDARMVRTGLAVQSMEVVRHQHQFMARLQHAIALQTEAVRSAEQVCLRAREMLVMAERKVAMTQKLMDLRMRELRANAARQDQLLMDEMAQSAHARNRRDEKQGESSWQ